MPTRRLTATALAALLVAGQGSAAVGPVSAAPRIASGDASAAITTSRTLAATAANAAANPATPPGPKAGLDASGLPAPHGATSLVSANVNGGFATGPSIQASISESGRYVAFSSRAADLVPNDTNNAQDVFVVDRRTGRATILPLPGGGPVPQGGQAVDPSISADGSVVAFTYYPAPSFSGTVLGSILLVWDRSTGKTTIVSRRTDKTVASGSREASVSGDGSRIAFTSDANGIGANDTNDHADVFVLDRTTGQTTLVSATPAGTPGGGTSGHPSISADGRIVAFDSVAADLLTIGGGAQSSQVYARDLAAGTTELVSVNTSGGYGGGASQAPATSADGHAIAFESTAPDLTAGDTSVEDVFVRDRTAKTTTLVSVNQDGGPADGPSGQAAIAADGRIVAFVTTAKNLVAFAGPPIVLAAAVIPASEVMARDLVLGDTIRISESKNGGPGGGASVGPAVGGDGRYVAFASSSPILVAGDGNQLADVFLRDLPPDPLVSPPKIDFGALAIGQPGLPLAAIVTNRGWGPLQIGTATRTGPAAADFSVLANGCAGTPVHRSESCTISVGFTATAKGSRTATLVVPGNFSGPARTVRLVGVGSKAVLKLDPDNGPPGIVTMVSGSGFPAGVTLTLTWSIGITPQLGKVVTDSNGTFLIGVLVFHHDIVGLRQLVATRVAGPLFPPAEAPMLVTSAPDIPSTYNWQLAPPYGPPLIVRR